jgi:hypothetical protein
LAQEARNRHGTAGLEAAHPLSSDLKPDDERVGSLLDLIFRIR